MTKTLLIPKIIHRIWLGNDPMPDSCIRFGKTWEENHPGWTMKLWRDPEELPFKLRLYHIYRRAISRRGSGGAITSHSPKTTFLRLEIIYNIGGIYIDTDFECVKSLEPLLPNIDAFVGMTQPRLRIARHQTPRICNAIFGAQPKHPWIGDMIERIINDARLRSPSEAPEGFSDLALEHKVKIFLGKFFYPFLRHEIRGYRKDPTSKTLHEDTYAIHHWGGTWR